MIIVKIILIVLIALSLLLLAYSNKLKNIGKLVSIFLFIIGSFFIIFPNLSDSVASFFGIGRGVDLILYISTTVLLLLVAILYSRERIVNNQITILVRNKTIQNAKKL